MARRGKPSGKGGVGKTFPAGIRFRFPWRPYQARVLAELSTHLADDRLHVIAPPGSGKTVLGLETLLRLNRPALVLSPTRTIRDQWVDRFVQLFLPAPYPRPDWISTDPRRPGLLTAITYQALHRLHADESAEETDPPEEPVELSGESDADDSDEDEEETDRESKTRSRATSDSAFGGLRRAGVRTLVVDEAHHLRNAWWRSLTALHECLDRPSVVALTATPPFDVSPAEWVRYRSFCGPVDAEIAVPELVIERNLCPHQDYVFLSAPAEDERCAIREFREGVDAFVADLALDLDFIEAVALHPWMVIPEDHSEAIFADTAYFSGMLVFLHHVGGRVSPEALDTLGVRRDRIPPLDREWLETLLTGVLFRDPEHFESAGRAGAQPRPAVADEEKAMDMGSCAPAPVAERLKDIRRRLRRIGALERRQVSLRSTAVIRKRMIRSIGKLESIVEIVRAEGEAMGEALRMVVLADFIYAGDMPAFIDDLKPLRRIGVVPIFERLRRECLWNIRPGILCGSLVVVPETAVADFRMIAAEFGTDLGALRFEPLGHDPGHCAVRIEGTAGSAMVPIMTELLRLGPVNVLVGTASLLGEGWDAPFLNTLVLASRVGSWVLSNQMRGRAIRTEAGNPDKTANIWHLACVVPGMHPETDGGAEDLNLLCRRFESFVGVSADGGRIENGAERLVLPEPPWTETALAAANAETLRRAADRHGLRAAWESALDRGPGGGRMVEEIAAPAEAIPGRILIRTVRGLLFREFLAFLPTGLCLFAAARGMGVPPLFWTVAAGFAGYGLFRLPRTIRAAGLRIRFGSSGGTLRQIARAVRDTLIHLDRIRPEAASAKIVVETGRDRTVACSLRGGSTLEKSIFLDALQEVVDPVGNPRYLLRRKTKRRGVGRYEYFPVPDLLGKRKESAEHFRRMWRKHLGPAELIFTRNPEGRRILVEARLRSLQADAPRKARRGCVWK
jgi:hypothetical protein